MKESKDQLQAVVFGALLHDIGKFMQRAEVPLSVQSLRMESTICKLYPGRQGRYSHKHVLWTHEFFEMFSNHPVLGMTLESDSMANLAAYHHRPSSKLQEVIQLSDCLSSGSDRVDDEDEEHGGGRNRYKRVRLHSVFDYLAFEKGQAAKAGHRYEFDPVDDMADNCFPSHVDNLDPKEEESLVGKYADLWAGFRDELEELAPCDPEQFFVTLLALLEKYTWCIPSTTVQRPDISLYDHARTTGAIAGALYLYHQDKGDLASAHLRATDEEKKFVLLVGDISGIQNYIFNIKNVGVGGIAKRLRARSFFLSALAEIASHKYLHAFGLPIVNLVMSSGGKFYLLLPKTGDCITVIDRLRHEMDRWLMENLNAEVAVNIATTDFSCRELLEFNAILKTANDNLQRVKSVPFQTVTAAGKGWNEGVFVFEHTQFADQESLCVSCGKFPGVTRQDQQIVMCRHCYDDVELGRRLTTAKGIQFYSDCDRGRFKIFDYSFSVLSDLDKAAKEAYLVCQFNDWTFGSGGAAIWPRYFANHVPVFDESLCRYCEKTDCKEKENAEVGNPKFFTCLAHASRGHKVLGVLKADVDNLGLIFINGFKTEQEKSISRIASLSRLLDTFFTGRVDYLLREEFSDIYTVYSGGDDILLVGPWSTILQLTLRLREEFVQYCCGNPDFTISAGIALAKPRLPIYAAIDGAEQLLKRAKHAPALGEEKPKNQLAVFDDLVKWEKADRLLEEADRLADWQEEKKVSMGFVRQLLDSSEQFRRFKEMGETKHLRFVPLLAYSIARNISTKEDEIAKWAQGLTDLNDENLKNLTFIANYSIARNRS